MRTAVTIIELAPGSQEWAVAMDPSTNPQDHRDFIKSLPTGDQRAVILETGGFTKRRRVTWAPAKKGPTRLKKAK